MGERIPYAREYVRKFILKCPICQKSSQIKVPISTSPFVTSSYAPMRAWHIDTIGPLPESYNGNQHIIVIIDAFTRWVELYSVKSTGSEEAALVLIKQVGRYGCPCTIRSDKGTQYVNELISSLTTKLNLEHEQTMSYSKEENGLVERANKEVMRHLRAILMDQQIYDRWEDYLPMVMRIINSKTHTVTGVSPAQLLYGHKIDLDRRILQPAHQMESEQTFHEWVNHMTKQQDKIIDIALQHQLEVNVEHMNSCNDQLLTEFPDDSYVLLSYPTRPPTKLLMEWRGPFKVLSHHGSRYEIRNLVTMKSMEVHISRLKAFHYDENKIDPRSIANQEAQVYDVKCIHKHIGNTKKVSTLKFFVEWVGFPDHEDYTWIDWKELRTNIILHQYLVKVNLSKLIPSGFAIPNI
jgi:hypothetical protein